MGSCKQTTIGIFPLSFLPPILGELIFLDYYEQKHAHICFGAQSLCTEEGVNYFNQHAVNRYVVNVYFRKQPKG